MDFKSDLLQVKSAIQPNCNDTEDAKEIQSNIVILQADEIKDQEFQTTDKTTCSVLDCESVVGDVKGVIYHDIDTEHQAIIYPSQTIGLTGCGRFFVGPSCAIVDDLSGLSDMKTRSDDVIHEELQPSGQILTTNEIYEQQENSTGKIFDLTFGVAINRLIGLSDGHVAEGKAQVVKGKVETLEWFHSLEFGIQVQYDYEINRLISIRSDIINIKNNCPQYEQKAVEFARGRNPTTVSLFCSFIKFFESTYISKRDEQQPDYDLEFQQTKNKPNKKKWISEKTINSMTNEFLVQKYDATMRLVKENKMVTNSSIQNPNIRIDISPLELIGLVRNEAQKNNIRFATAESALYHVLIHPVYPLDDYVRLANKFISGNFHATLAEHYGDGIDIHFVDLLTRKKAIVLVKNGAAILKTFF